MTQKDVSEMMYDQYESAHAKDEPLRNMLVNLDSRYKVGDSI
jgi:hypothetical protein